MGYNRGARHYELTTTTRAGSGLGSACVNSLTAKASIMKTYLNKDDQQIVMQMWFDEHPHNRTYKRLKELSQQYSLQRSRGELPTGRQVADFTLLDVRPSASDFFRDNY